MTSISTPSNGNHQSQHQPLPPQFCENDKIAECQFSTQELANFNSNIANQIAGLKPGESAILATGTLPQLKRLAANDSLLIEVLTRSQSYATANHPRLRSRFLLRDIRQFIARYLVLTPAQLDALALWVVHTHAIDAAEFTPYLHVQSPVKRSGKSTLLEVLELLVARACVTGRITAAALARVVDGHQATMLMDENDTVFNAGGERAEDLRGMLNNGFTRGKPYIKCHPKDPKATIEFDIFGPKVVSGIGRLAETVEDRSIPIEMKRKLPNEVTQRFRQRRVSAEAERLSHRADNLARTLIPDLKLAEPHLPDSWNDRQQDVAEPLLAIADYVGGDWPENARKALSILWNTRAPEQEIEVELIRDIRGAFQKTDGNGAVTGWHDKMFTKELIGRITAASDSAWHEFNKGKPITEPQLAKELRKFKIKPGTVRIGETTSKGYKCEQFQEAWDRYL